MEGQSRLLTYCADDFHYAQVLLTGLLDGGEILPCLIHTLNVKSKGILTCEKNILQQLFIASTVLQERKHVLLCFY